ncbi:DUF4886 domain-containing protein [Planctomycetales bacterium ZRK34]|nr:DUF4886 domain-containing protein [Planctomycetales bacterium ZRK34]
MLVVVQAVALAESKTVRVLTVGNSFANNALRYLPQIAEAAGDKLIFGKANLGGCSLQRHWSHVEKYEADHDDKAGRPYSGKFSLAQMLEKDHWDFVTIQQYSFISHDPATYRPYARNLYDYIRKHAPQAKVLIQQIWAYRVDDPRFKPANEGKQPHTQQVMYQQVRAAYHGVADELGIGILPSGDAMYLADTDPTWGYKPDTTFDFAKAAPPALPDQAHSLHVGYRWRKQSDGGQKLSMDGHHAGRAGEYLIGCVWYEVLFGKSVVDNSYVPGGIDADYARFLRQTAHRAVSELKR